MLEIKYLRRGPTVDNHLSFAMSRSRVYTHASYNEVLASGQFSTEENCCQYLIDMKILPTKRRCPTCENRMELIPCSTTKYREGSCWKCPCGVTTSVRTDSVLQNSNLSYRNFILILSCFAENLPASRTAESIGVAETTVRRFYSIIREQIAADVQTSSKIGGPGTVVEVDEAKFGKRKYNRGRMVRGSWVIGGIQRGTDSCFMEICPGNVRDEPTLTTIIQEWVHPGTTVITDGWKGYWNLNNYGFVHLDVKHCRNFVDPVTGAHTNCIEGTWTHAKNAARLNRGGRRTTDSLQMDLSLYMWMRQHGLTRIRDSSRALFSRHLPHLLNYRRFYDV